MSRKYFGTDGVRGKVGEYPITPEFVLHLGYAAGKVLAASRGARLLRVHDVRGTVDALAVWQAVEQGRPRRDPATEQ